MTSDTPIPFAMIGVVVNNAIFLVHQTLNFMKRRGESDMDIIEKMGYREAIFRSSFVFYRL